MRAPILLFAAACVFLARAEPRTVLLSAQLVSSHPVPPRPLAKVRYDPELQSAANVIEYDPPDLPPPPPAAAKSRGGEGKSLVRLGVWDESAGDWAGSTTLTSTETFARGFMPVFVLSLAPDGVSLLAASCRGVRIDAGVSRDFGPRAFLVPPSSAPLPQLNLPVVLSPEGKKVVPPEEKTILQRYWWLIVVVALMLMFGGGGGGGEQK